MRDNSGVVITGGRQKVGQMVVGDHAIGHQVVHSPGPDLELAHRDLAAKLAELIRVLQREHPELPEGEYLVGDARRVAVEVTKPQPDKGTLSSLLHVLSEGTKGLESAATIVTAIKTLAITVLGIV